MKNNIYCSLDEAREEIRKRFENKELKKKVEDYLSNNFIPGLSADEPKAVFAKSVVSPSWGYDFFCVGAKYLGLNPLLAEYTDDLFTGLSEDKLLLSRLSILWNDGTKKKVDIVNYKEYHAKQIPEVRVFSGERLIDFHHNLFKLSQYPASKITDMSKYFKSYGRPKDYYPYYLANFICHGVLFEKFETNPKTHEYKFTKEVAVPVIDFLEEKFGFKPIIVKLYPDNQSKDEDFSLGCYNKNINDFLIDYVSKNNCVIKEF